MAPTEESAPEVPVTEEVMPDLEVPEDSGAQPTSRSGAVDVRALAKDVAVSVREILLGDEEFIKRSQAVKDKRLKLLDEENPALVQRVVKYLKKYDGDEEEVARQIRLDALAEGARASAKEPSGEADPGRSEPRGPEPKEDLKSWVSRQLTEAGIPFDHPDYKAVLAEFKQGQFDPAEFRGAVRGLVARLRASASVSPSAAVSESTGAGVTVTQRSLVESYVKDMNAARGNREELRLIKARYRERGVDVDRVDLTPGKVSRPSFPKREVDTVSR